MTSPQALCFNTRYHIFSRGNNRENIFHKEDDYRLFMALFLKHVSPYVEVYAYCLMRNHFHLFLKVNDKVEIMINMENDTTQDKPSIKPPSQCFSNLLNAYAKKINIDRNRTGSLFQHPFHRISVPQNRYSTNLIQYIHRNPQHHGFVKDFREWPFSSYHSLEAGKDSDGHIITTRIEEKGSLRKSLPEKRRISIGHLVAGDFL